MYQRIEKDAPQGVLVVKRLFGRRAVPLHLSGFPCPYQRRVVDTKFTTSKSLFLCPYYKSLSM